MAAREIAPRPEEDHESAEDEERQVAEAHQEERGSRDGAHR